MTIGTKNNDVVRGRIDFATKQEATAILSEIGLTLSAIAEHREEHLPTYSSIRAPRANMQARAQERLEVVIETLAKDEPLSVRHRDDDGVLDL